MHPKCRSLFVVVDIYDLQGRKVNGTSLPGGIYIVNGKKVLRKE